MRKIFKGRSIYPGNLIGEALVTHVGFNTLASFYNSCLSGSEKAICSDHDNKELYGKVITDKILCLPQTTGSTSSGGTWDWVASMNIAPKALLFSKHIDSLAAAGLAIAEIWANHRIVAIDQIGNEFLEYVKEKQQIIINDDGSIEIN